MPEERASAVTRPISDAPAFAWDRPETSDSLRARLAEADTEQWIELVAWIMREARIDEVWQFASPAEIAGRFDALEPRLGRRRELWNYLLQTWRELGKL